MRKPSDLDHDYMLPNGLVRGWLTSDDVSSTGDIKATVAFTLGHPPACIVACPAARLFDEGEDIDVLTQKIIDKTHRILRAAASGYHVDCFRDIVGEWILQHRRATRYLIAA